MRQSLQIAVLFNRFAFLCYNGTEQFFIAQYIQVYIHIQHFHAIFFSDRERARYEATVRLGNASQYSQSDNRNERRRPNEHLPTILEKHVS